MPKERNIKLFLADILEAIGSIRTYTRGMGYQEFKGDKKTRDAVFRNLEVIGEAIKSIPSSIKRKYPNVNWRAATGMRDKLIHEYFGVSPRIVWDTITNDLPTLENDIKEIMEQET